MATVGFTLSACTVTVTVFLPTRFFCVWVLQVASKFVRCGTAT